MNWHHWKVPRRPLSPEMAALGSYALGLGLVLGLLLGLCVLVGVCR